MQTAQWVHMFYYEYPPNLCIRPLQPSLAQLLLRIAHLAKKPRHSIARPSSNAHPVSDLVNLEGDLFDASFVGDGVVCANLPRK